jgi:tellurite resistance protein
MRRSLTVAGFLITHGDMIPADERLPMTTPSSSKLALLPITLFGSVMGLSGLAVALVRTDHVLGWHLGVGRPLLWAVFGWFLVLSLLYLIKFLRHSSEVQTEYLNPVRVNFFPAISISLLLLGIGFLDVNRPIASVLWWIGTPVHLLFCIKIMHMWFFEDLQIQSLNPAWFIPIVGTILVPIAGVPLGHLEISWFFYSIGLIFWLVLLTIVFYRILFHPAMAEKFLPTLFILIPPPTIGFIALVRLTGGLGDTQRILYNFGLFMLILLGCMLPRFRKVPYYVSWWAYTFPLASITIATLLMHKLTGSDFHRWLGIGLLAVTIVVNIVVIVRTLQAVRQGDICVPEL